MSVRVNGMIWWPCLYVTSFPGVVFQPCSISGSFSFLCVTGGPGFLSITSSAGRIRGLLTWSNPGIDPAPWKWVPECFTSRPFKHFCWIHFGYVTSSSSRSSDYFCDVLRPSTAWWRWCTSWAGTSGRWQQVWSCSPLNTSPFASFGPWRTTSR